MKKRNHYLELEGLVAEELKHDLRRKTFEEFMEYHNSSIDCLRCMYSVHLFYTALEELGMDYKMHLNDYHYYKAELKKLMVNPTVNKYKIQTGESSLKEAKEKLRVMKGEVKTLPFLNWEVRDFLGSALYFSSDRYKEIIKDFAKINGMPPMEITLTIREDYSLIRPVLGEPREWELYERLKDLVKQGHFMRASDYILRKIRIKK